MAGTNFNIGVNDNDVVSKLDRIINKVESMGQVSKTVGKELYEALGTLKDTGSIQKAWEALDSVIKENSKSISTLTEEVKEYRRLAREAEGNLNFKEAREYEKMANAAERLLGFRKEMSNALDETNQKLVDQAQKLENAENKQKSFRTELMETTNEYRQMVRAMQNGEAVDPQKLEAVKKKWIELKGAMRQMNAETSILNSANPALTATIHAIQGVTGAFSVAQGVMGLFNSKSEEMQKIMLRVQSLMSIMMGLQQIQNTLLAKNAIVTNTLGKLKTWWAGVLRKATVAQVAETTATTAATTATTGFARAIRVLGVAIKSVPIIGWILALVAAIAALISHLTELSISEKAAQEANEDFAKSWSEKIAEPITKVRELERAWNNAKFTPMKDDFLKDAIKKFQELGYAVKDVKTAEDLLTDPQTVQRLLKAEELKAKAAAARALVVDYTAKWMDAVARSEYWSGIQAQSTWAGRNLAFWSESWKADQEMTKAGDDSTKYWMMMDKMDTKAKKFREELTNLFAEIGVGEYTPGPSTSGGGKKQKTPEEIAADYDEYLKKVDETIKKSKDKRLKDARDAKTESIADGLEKELQKITNEEADAIIAAGEWWNQMIAEGQAKMRQLFKDTYKKDAPEDWDSQDKTWLAFLEKMDWKSIEDKIGNEMQAMLAVISDKYDLIRKNVYEKTAKDEAKTMLESLSLREEYEKQKLAITEKYEKLIKDAILNGDKEGAAKLAREGKNEIDELTTKYNKENAELFMSTTNRSRASLQDQLGKLKERLKTLQDTKGSLEEIKDIQEKMDDVQDALDEKDQIRVNSIKEIVMTYAKALGMQQKAKKLEEQAAEARERGDVKLAEQLEERAKRLRETAASLTEGLGTWWQMAITAVVEGFQLAAQYAKQIADITGDDSMANWAEQASALAQNLNAAWQGYQSTGSPYGAIAGGLSDMLEQTLNAKMEAKAWVAEFNRSIKNFRNAIELASVTFDADKFKDMFGERSLESATEAYKKMSEAQQKYNEKVTAAFSLGDREKQFKSLGDTIFQANNFLTTLTGFNSKGFDFGLGAFKSWFGLEKKTTQKWYSELDAYSRGLNQLQAMQVEVKHANGWARFWGKQSQYKSLYDVAPELWDENGEFNVENAERFLQVSKQLTNEQRDQIQNAIDLKKAYDDAKQALEDIIADTVGSFADDMADAVWEAITKGANAWDIFREKGNEALVALGKQMLKEFAISTYLEQFKDKLREAYGSGDMSNIANIYTEIFDGIPMVLENMTIAGENWVRMLKENGYDVTAAGATSGSTGGYTTQMSHEDASEINGRMTDIQMQIRLIQGNIVQIVSLQQETRGFARMQADYLYDIRRYTATLPTIAEYSKKIATNTANL